MLKNKKILLMILLVLLLIFLPNMVKATVECTRNIYSNNGSMKFTFTGLTLDTTHEYEFGLTKTAAAEVEKWSLITEYTESTAIIDVMTTTTYLRNVINAVDTGYITLRDKTENTVVLQPYSVNLKIPFLNVTNYTVIPNGKDLDANNSNIQVALRCASNSDAYYQYEKITDTNIINKYKEIKSKNGNIMELKSMLKTTVPSSNWTLWKYWNGYDSFAGMNGYGYPQRTVSVPENGLYYMWLYFSANGLKNIYGYILVDNLQPEIELESITLPSTKTIELDKTLTLTPSFNPSNATNKIVTWSSSDETVATVDNAGKVTGKKIGSAIITVTSQEGNKKASCTVTVVNQSTDPETSALKEIKIEKVANKVDYKVGEKFDKTGMVIKAIYEDGTSKQVENYTITPSTALKLSDTKVTIAYTENGVTKEAVHKIRVVNSNGNTEGGNGNGDDDSIAKGTMPYTGGTFFVIITVMGIAAVAIYVYKRNNDLKGI